MLRRCCEVGHLGVGHVARVGPLQMGLVPFLEEVQESPLLYRPDPHQTLPVPRFWIFQPRHHEHQIPTFYKSPARRYFVIAT